jgi:membrane associated rhomboid family serine protease
VVLFALLGVNLAGFLAQMLLQIYQPAAIPEYLGLSYRGIDQAYAWQSFTAMFLHAGVFGFAANLFVLYFVGRDLECIIGQKHFLYLYSLGAIGGELSHLFLMPPTAILLAASGGVAALVVAYGTVLPELEIAGSIFFLLPIKLKAKHCAAALGAVAVLLLLIDRHGVVGHSAWLGGGAAGWLYAHLLGFGRPSFVQRFLQARRLERERRRRLSPEEFIAEQIDPILEKISRRGLGSLSRAERRTLAEAHARMSAARA